MSDTETIRTVRESRSLVIHHDHALRVQIERLARRARSEQLARRLAQSGTCSLTVRRGGEVVEIVLFHTSEVTPHA